MENGILKRIDPNVSFWKRVHITYLTVILLMMSKRFLSFGYEMEWLRSGVHATKPPRLE
jgi:hypothetical protein